MIYKHARTIIIIMLMFLSGCGGSGGANPQPKVVPSIITTLDANNATAVSRISVSTQVKIYSIEMLLKHPQGSLVSTVSSTGVALGMFTDHNLDISSGDEKIILADLNLNGFNSGEIIIVNFSNVPLAATPSNFTISSFIAKDINGITIQ